MKKIVPLGLMLSVLLLTGCSTSPEIKGTYYKTSTGGSAMFFKPDNEPQHEIWLHDKDNFINDKNLYKTFDLSKYYDGVDGCRSFSGTATLVLKDIEKTGDNSSNAKVVEVKDRTEPVCNP